MANRHFYLRDFTKENKHPVGCVAIEVRPETNEIRYAFSACSPLDKFNSRVARDKATGRLVSHPIVINCKVPEKGYEITQKVMEDIISKNTNQEQGRSFLAYDAAQQWLNRSEQLNQKNNG